MRIIKFSNVFDICLAWPCYWASTGDSWWGASRCKGPQPLHNWWPACHRPRPGCQSTRSRSWQSRWRTRPQWGPRSVNKRPRPWVIAALCPKWRQPCQRRTTWAHKTADPAWWSSRCWPAWIVSFASSAFEGLGYRSQNLLRMSNYCCKPQRSGRGAALFAQGWTPPGFLLGLDKDE